MEKWHPPECLFYKTKSGCRFGEKCSFAHRQVDEQPTKRSKSNNDKSVEELYPTPHIHEQMTTSNYGYDNIMLEPNAMNNIDTVAHMNMHNTKY